jgi:hypothetical protein
MDNNKEISVRIYNHSINTSSDIITISSYNAFNKILELSHIQMKDMTQYGCVIFYHEY